MKFRNLKILALASLALALACGPALSRQVFRPQVLRAHLFRPHRPFRIPPPLLLPAPEPFVPEPFVPEGPESAPAAPMNLPPLDYGGASPPLSGGMVITITKLLSEDPKSDDRAPAISEISRPRQAAEQLATCWSPPVPPRGDTVEITIRFGFDKSGLVQGSPRVTYVKAAPGMSDEAVRDSISAAIKACTPIHFTASMAAAIPGYPMSVRFIGRRADENASPRETPPKP